VLSGCCHRKNQNRPRPNGRAREWIIERCVEQDGYHADSPDRSNRRPYPPKGKREHRKPHWQSPFRSPLQPIAVCLIDDGSGVKCGEGRIDPTPTPHAPANPGMSSYHMQRRDKKLNAPCSQGLRRESRRRCCKSHNQREKSSAKPIRRPARDALTTTAVSSTAEIPRKVYEFRPSWSERNSAMGRIVSTKAAKWV
jgi:hypothetical protein